MKNPNLNDQSKYVSITMEFRCNLKCNHCMIEGTMDTFDVGEETQYQSILDEQKKIKRWDGLILTGSEITLNKNLPDMVIRARESGFEYVRIQTHGMHLHRQEYLRKLLNSGVNEFFISVAGSNSRTHDEITKVKGSFDKLMKGINMIEDFSDAIVITNTVVTQQSYRELEGIVDLFANYKKVVQHEFWNFFPMNQNDVKNLIVPYPLLMPFVIGAINACEKYNKTPEVKNIPECLMHDSPHVLVNTQPSLFIDPKFWDEFDKNEFHKCKYQEVCNNQQCLGLTSAYVEKYGYEEEFLRPFLR